MAVLNCDYYKGTDEYSDGSVEDVILKVVKEGKGLEDLRVEEVSYPILYHLSSERENILNWYNFKEGSSVLEIGAGLGAITGVLCRKCSKVTAVELSKRRATINYERHKDEDNLTIMVGNLNDMTFDEKYDYVILNGVFEYAMSFTEGDRPYHTFFNKVVSFLKPLGKVIIAIENRLGLKYFAGAPEDHTDAYMLGLNEYADNNSVRTFSKAELTDILTDCGFTHNRFFYPYPDYKFPRVIFTDETINNMGYGYDYQDYTGKRILLFNESAVAKSLAREGVAASFSNSFLVEASKVEDEGRENVIYAKISSDRKKEYRIITAIEEKEGKRIVRKSPVCKEAEQHIEALADNTKNCVGKNFRYVLSSYNNNTVMYDYIDKETVAVEIERLIKSEDVNGIIRLIDEIYNKVFKAESTMGSFKSMEFLKVFGEMPDDEEVLCMKPANVDMIFDNMFRVDGKISVIDAEWIMDFNIPMDFIIFRSINELYNNNNKLNSLIPRKEMLLRYHIDSLDEARYNRWNRYFIKEYVGADYLEKYSKDKYRLNLHKARENDTDRNYIEPSLYIDRGAGFSEEGKLFKKVEVIDNRYEISFEIENINEVKAIRFDPLEREFIWSEVYADTESGLIRINAVNAEKLETRTLINPSKDMDMFLTTDPMYMISMDMLKGNNLTLKGVVLKVSNEEIMKFIQATRR